MASEYWVTQFELNSAPLTGLSPTITIIELPNTVDVSAQAMTEIANLPGSYYYLHTTYDVDKNYKARANAGTDSVDARYTYATNNDDIQMSDKLPTNYIMGSSVVTDKDGVIDTINGNVDQSLSTTESNIRGTDSDDLKDISDEIAAISVPSAATIADAVWDEPIVGHTNTAQFGGKNQKVVPSETIGDYKADVSALATEANATTNTANIIVEVDANETKIDAVKVDTAAIKVKTDNLPADTSAILNRILGVSDENSYIDNYSYSSGYMIGCRKRIYNSAANAAAHGATGLLATYTVTVTWSGANVASYLMVIV